MLRLLLTFLALTTLHVIASPISSPITPRQDITCASGVHIIHARGSTESQEEDKTLPVVNALLDAIPGSDEQDVDYPAAIISDDSFYSTSVADGIDDLKSQIKTYVGACGDDSRIVLLGYSQGANVISTALAGGLVSLVPLDMKYKKYIKGAALFGDPTFAANQPINAGSADGPGIFGRIFPSTTILNQYSSMLRSYCAEGDFFCDAGGNLDVHYAEVDTYEQDAVDFIVGLVGQ